MITKNKSGKLIEARDIYGNTYKNPVDDFTYRISVYGVLRQDDKILVQRYPKVSTFSLPGGGMEMHETIDEALSREFREETGLVVKPVQLIGVFENFFTFDNKFFHSIQIVYKVKKIGGELIADIHTDDSVDPQFMSLQELKEGKIHISFKNIIELIIKNAY